MSDLSSKLCHLSSSQSEELSAIITEYSDLFPDVPGRTVGTYHDVDVGEARPIKQHPYRAGPKKADIIRNEVQYMLDNKIIEPCSSPWSSPCILTPKPDGSWRFVTDFRKVNEVTKTDCYPLPRINTLIDQVGDAQYVSKFDLLKGYWQIPLTERAKDISSFCTESGLYRYLVSPFGMKNSGCTFQRFMDKIVTDLENTKVYVDDLLVFSTDWDEHVKNIRALFNKLREHKLTVSLVKSDFVQATVKYLGHVVGQGKILPSSAKIQAIVDFAVPDNKKAVQRLVGIVGFYRRFCPNLSTIIAPLTNLLSSKIPFIWDEQCQLAFEKVKKILTSSPVLQSPDYNKEFKLYVDSSDVGCIINAGG